LEEAEAGERALDSAEVVLVRDSVEEESGWEAEELVREMVVAVWASVLAKVEGAEEREAGAEAGAPGKEKGQ
jgi:hypothetical protein